MRLPFKSKLNKNPQIIDYWPTVGIQTSGAKTKKQNRAPGINDLKVSLADAQTANGIQPSDGNLGGESANGKILNSRIPPLAMGEYFPMLPFLQAVWEKINDGLDYPGDLAKQRIIGEVVLHLAVDSKGVLQGSFHSIESSNTYLETYVLAVLIQALRTPIENRFWCKRGVTPLTLRFEFETYTEVVFENKDRGELVGNTLRFRRAAYVEPILNENIEKLLTRYVPPIIIFPGGFYIDFVHAYEYVKNWRQPKEEDLRQARLENLRKRLEGSIKRKQDH